MRARDGHWQPELKKTTSWTTEGPNKDIKSGINIRLSLLKITNSNLMHEVLLFVHAKMADENNFSSKLPVAEEQERSEEESYAGNALTLAFC